MSQIMPWTISTCILLFKIQNKLLHFPRHDFKYSSLKLIKIVCENVWFHLIVTLVLSILGCNIKHF